MFRKPCLQLSLILFFLNSLVSCGGSVRGRDIDPAYASKLKNVRTDGRGNEIVGVWVSETHCKVDGPGPAVPVAQSRLILLLKPDGTGILRTSHLTLTDIKSIYDMSESKLKWQYSQNGVWTVRYTGEKTGMGNAGEAPTWFLPGVTFPHHISVRLTNDALLWDAEAQLNPETSKVDRWVFVRS